MSSVNFKFFGKMGGEGPLFRKMTPKTAQTSAFHLEAEREIVYHKRYQKCNTGLVMP
jgi:hypothetical protein